MTVVFLLMGTALAACGGSDQTAADGGAGGSTAATVVHVVLKDSPSAQSVESDLTTFKAGVPYHFVVENTGSLAHELMIVKPIEAGTMDMTEMDEMALYVLEEDDLEAGTTQEFDFTFPADSAGTPLEFACHISGHYELGMHETITVDA